MSDYKKSIEDEVDWKIIDQLHNATNNFSSYSLEFKKIYFIILGISIPLIFKLSGDKLNVALFFTPLTLSFSFWFLDSFTYYYQEKLREKMDSHFENLKKRNSSILSSSETSTLEKQFTLPNNRTSKKRLLRSIFNHSSLLFIVLIFLNLLLIYLYYAKFI